MTSVEDHATKSMFEQQNGVVSFAYWPGPHVLSGEHIPAPRAELLVDGKLIINWSAPQYPPQTCSDVFETFCTTHALSSQVGERWRFTWVA